MLEELTIKNYALIEDLVINFDPGLNILSGETGAGKSIVIGAIGLIIGSKGDASSIRSGCSESNVSCVIKIPKGNEAVDWLEEHEIEPEDERIIIRRVVRQSGRGSIFIQSVPSSRKNLEELSSYIFDMHGQHSHQSLLNIENQRKLVDRYAGVEEDVYKLKNNFLKLSELKADLENMKKTESDLIMERELLVKSIDEIDKANLNLDEESDLVKERTILLQHDKLIEYLAICRNALSEHPSGALAVLRTGRAAMDDLSNTVGSLKPLSIRLDNAFYEIEDVFESLGQFQDTIDFTPGKLEECEDRLQLIHILQKKYGSTIKEILEYKDQADNKIISMETFEGDRIRQEEAILTLEKQVIQNAGGISKKRIEFGKKLEDKIKTNLVPMGMPKAVFKVEVSLRENNAGKPSCGPTGLDKIEYLISPNEGEPLKPLKNIASGGELSRIMLSIKSVLAESDSVLSLIFDEIDTGIGGEVALSVGDHLAEIGKRRQILCITHLASIAVHADRHIKVEKNVVDGRTVTTIKTINEVDRVSEIARMLSGDISGMASLDHAQELLDKYSS
ncbi:MAG: DNA repair protein RecN [Spirochaetia bacterium]|jgi:DNA repair protein RecN (Recombination protein N)|nr:DNA repair protein RecN [Spirochaetia bacterium]